jgi:phospholipid/cholesterol/gamma-HCH transport system substrate-binding protein
MAVERSYARLGLFLVVALVVVLASSLLFIQRLRSRTAIEFVSYTTENVSGLDVASPVRYRGVSIGRVTDVRVDTHGGTIEIDFQIFLDRLKSIGANVEKIRQTADVLGTFPNLRAQIIGNPVTGEAYLLLDAPANPPAPMALGFTPDRAYVPSMPTTLSSMRDRLPEVLERAETTLQVLGEIVSRIPGSLDRSDRFFANVERIVQESNLPALSADSRKFFATSGAQIERIASEMEGVVGTRGTLTTFVDEARAAIKAADLPATNQSARAAADQTTLAADDLRRSLPAIRDSLEQLRALARQLQEQPESVVYGPRPAAVKR